MNVFIITSGAAMSVNLIEAHADFETAKRTAENAFKALARTPKQREEAEEIISQGWMQIPIPQGTEKVWAMKRLYELHPQMAAIEIIETELVMPDTKVN